MNFSPHRSLKSFITHFALFPGRILSRDDYCHLGYCVTNDRFILSLSKLEANWRYMKIRVYANMSYAIYQYVNSAKEI
jgi:hypothetical protein